MGDDNLKCVECGATYTGAIGITGLCPKCVWSATVRSIKANALSDYVSYRALGWDKTAECRLKEAGVTLEEGKEYYNALEKEGCLKNIPIEMTKEEHKKYRKYVDKLFEFEDELRLTKKEMDRILDMIWDDESVGVKGEEEELNNSIKAKIKKELEK